MHLCIHYDSCIFLAKYKSLLVKDSHMLYIKKRKERNDKQFIELKYLNFHLNRLKYIQIYISINNICKESAHTKTSMINICTQNNYAHICSK